MPIDTTNKFLIGVQGDEIVALRPLPQRFSVEDALLLAAYLVALAEGSDRGVLFGETLKAVLEA